MDPIRFSYARREPLGQKNFDDGVFTPLEGGVHVRMWGGENYYFVTRAGSQSGHETVCLVSSIVDSTDVPVRKWTTKSDFSKDWQPQYARWLEETCAEVAAEIGAHVDDPSRARLAGMLFQYFSD